MLPERLQLKPRGPDHRFECIRSAFTMKTWVACWRERGRFHWFDRFDPQQTALIGIANLAVVQAKIGRPP
jgi:hypothetical protein